MGQLFAQSNFPSGNWADSVMNTLSIEQKIGQLFMVPAYSNKDEAHRQYIHRLIADYHIGGLIFMQGTPERQVSWANEFQAAARIPLLMSQDAEWGPSMRLKKALKFPKNMTLGAIRDDSLIYEFGAEVAYQCKRVGVQVNFAPVMDVNNNPLNPVINYRSFGENKYNVARKGLMMMHGMQNNGVMACAKHFPGHGDTDTDSHLALPIIPHSRERLDTLELYPFQQAIRQGVGSVMIAHLNIPSLDPTPKKASTLSGAVVTDLLRDKMHFSGLIFTDALNMKGVSAFNKPGEVDMAAFEAGNDVLLFPQDVPKAMGLFKQAVVKGKLPLAELNNRVHRILQAKYQLGLDTLGRLPVEGSSQDLNRIEAQLLRKKLYEAAITLPKNDSNLLPLQQLEAHNIAYIQVGGKPESPFVKRLRTYTQVKPFYLSGNPAETERAEVMRSMMAYTTVVVNLIDLTYKAKKDYGITPGMRQLMENLNGSRQKVILAVHGSPYSLKYFGHEDAIVLAYEDAPEAQEAAASAIMGGLKVDGRMPVTASESFPAGSGYVIPKAIRFGFALPEEVKMQGSILNRIDSLAELYVRKKAMPGCAILVARGDQIVYHKGFGKTRPGKLGRPIDPYQHTYDMASVTKVAATTMSVMKLVEEGYLQLDVPIETYLPELAGTDKASLTLRRLLQHNAGLIGWKPFYMDTYSDPRRGVLNKQYYSSTRRDSFQIQLSAKLFCTPSLTDTVWKWVKETEVRDTRRVRYSDIGLILTGKIIESVTHSGLDQYVSYHFYRPLGMNQTSFNPGLQGKAANCPPTELDNNWRRCAVQGFVHDQASSLLGGIAGHAGLFSNVYDLAKLMMMAKNRGTYGGERYLQPVTLSYFTQKQLSYNRKGLGWDKPEFVSGKSSPVSAYCSKDTYGHTGFTGTSVWVDPAADMVFIFLSNRTFPSSRNRLLLRENVRIKIMDQIYEAMVRPQNLDKVPKNVKVGYTRR
ncbi:MAG: glycoside hydrolase family 3 N-terminal domain-containing protein [Bacteroidota bacterium]